MDAMEEAITTATATANATTSSLNDLPDHLVLHILSFLPTLDTIQTSLLSRKFRPFWSLLPSLNFSYSRFPPSETPSDTRQFFSEFIDRTLIHRPQSHLLKFRLEFIFNDRYAFHVDSWVRYAVKNLAQEIDLDFFIDKDFITLFDDDVDNYDFPFSILRNSRVRVLKLSHCGLALPRNMSDMRLWTITSMLLDQIFITDEMVSDLLHGCPNLEILKLDDCYGMEHWRICSVKLKELALIEFYRGDSEKTMEIDCPNLLSLTLDCIPVDRICVTDLSSLVKFDVFIVHMEEFYGYWETAMKLLAHFPHIKSLIAQNWWLKLAPKDAFSKSFVLYNLKHLELKTGYTKYDLLGMAALLELSPNLGTMILGYLFKIEDDESLSEELSNKPINFSMPSLKQVKLKEFRGTENEINFLVLLKMQAVVLEKIVIVPIKVGDISYPPIVLH